MFSACLLGTGSTPGLWSRSLPFYLVPGLGASWTVAIMNSAEEALDATQFVESAGRLQNDK